MHRVVVAGLVPGLDGVPALPVPGRRRRLLAALLGCAALVYELWWCWSRWHL